jgi:hypothetical protein
MSSLLPNIKFGSPIVFFDSHPEQQPGYAASWVYAFGAHLKIAWTGDVPKKLFPGTLRLVWWTVSLLFSFSFFLGNQRMYLLADMIAKTKTDGTQGLRDFELHQSELVKSLWDTLLENPDYSGQNPYVLSLGDNPWLTKEQKEKLIRRQNEEMWAKKSARRVETTSKSGNGTGKREQILEHIDEVIQSNEEAEKQRLLDVDKEDV